jgi:replicative DNA helicase
MMEESYSLDMQTKLLGMYMGNIEAFSHVENLFKSNIFTTTIFKQCFKVITAYHGKNIKSDMNIVLNGLIKLGIDKKQAVIAVSKLDVYTYLSAEHITEYVTSLFEEALTNDLVYFIDGISSSMTPQNVLEKIAEFKDKLTRIDLTLNNVSKEVSIKTQFKEAVNRIKNLKTGAVERMGFSWGTKSLDDATLGIVQGINVVAAGKGEGKSTLIINVIVENVIKKQLPMLFFSMEMTSIEVLTNVIANMRRINSKALRIGSVDESQILDIEAIESRLNESFVIDPTGGITHQYFKAKAKAFRKANNIPITETILVALDYLGLMKNSPDEAKMTKEEKIENICIELMCTCKEENIALLKLAQFSRDRDRRGNDSYAVKNDNDKLKALRPVLSDLKGSAAIESNAVTVLLLYRPEYFRILEANGKSFKDLCEINIAKGRYVSPEPVYVRFDGKYSLLEDIVEEEGGIQ